MLRRRGVVGLVVVLVAWLGATGPAAAHGGAATFEVQEVVGSAPGPVSVRFDVAYESDGHPAEGAIVEVVAVAADGSRSATSTAARGVEPGTYAASLDLPGPGSWTLVVTSSFPPGTIEVPVPVAGGDPADGGGAVVAPAEPDDTDQGQAAPDALDAADAEVVDEDEDGGGLADEDDGGTVTTNLVIAAVSAVVGGSLGLWASKRRSARKRAAVVDDDGQAPA